MTLSKEARRLAPLSFGVSGLMLAICVAGPIAAAPGFAPGRPGFGIGPRSPVASHARPVSRGDNEPRHARHDGGGGFGGVGVAILPLVPPVPTPEPTVSQDDALVWHAGERWASDEIPQRASCVRPLIIELRAPPKTPERGPRVIYGTAPPACPRS